ncbi:MAG: aromatic amino acid lyase, partial [Synergistaceae bacterium]|nr:aromatic amino acid lyase [Synergistaceae bacterium]
MMGDPSKVGTVVLDGRSLELEGLVAVARRGARVEVAPRAMEAMERSRALAERIAAEKRVAYGITTGFGDFQKVAVPEEMSNELSTNLILSHCTGTGDPYPEDVVRGMMLLRANALCAGLSGVRPLLVQMLARMLDEGVTPVVPQKG